MKTIFVVTFLAIAASPVSGSQDPKDTTAYQAQVETLPEPIGGMTAIQKYVRYPEIMKRAGIEGKVDVEAFVDKNGNVTMTRIIKGVHPALDKEAAEAVAKIRFTPGRHQGKVVGVRLTVPIRFRLDSKNKAHRHMLFQGNYEMSGGGITVPDNAEWKAMNIENNRVLLVLQEKWDNEGGGFWSVMSYLTKEEAKKLAEELRKAAEKIK